MSAEESLILSSELENSNSAAAPGNQDPTRFSRKKILLSVALAFALLLLAAIIFFVIKIYWLTPKSTEQSNSNGSEVADSSSTPTNLPNLNPPEAATTTVATSSFSNLAIEYLTFQDFYEAPENSITPKINDYLLPLNVKIDVINYYDISRKLNLDPGLDSLNNNGFALINNPWPQEALDFYALYGNLSNRQIPLLITSDFIIYYYQNIFKKVFKDVEENVFYDNLWDINKKMYTIAKNRYETRLAAIGDVNDSILEGERLETAFFAVALELLKPGSNQIAPKGVGDTKGLFEAADADHFYFVVPPYLRDDVLAEVKLIREGKAQFKSPVFLYRRNYAEFSVPADYLANAKLNNFYLTTKWLNSIFPLNYRGRDCSDCLLDQADWRINLTAASLISKDFASLPELKNKWARIYKVMSFFKGLREELNYVYYRDALTALFGPDYNIEELFDDQNKKGLGNLEKFRAKLSTYDFPEISGALVKTDPTFKSKLGFRMLAESYWPNTYIFSRLTAPAVGDYKGTSTLNNVTFCANASAKAVYRCNGMALDVINLAYPIGADSYFTENTNYNNYSAASEKLRGELTKNSVWHLNNYWATLSLLKAYLGMEKNNLPLFARSPLWQDRSLRTAAAAWINLQLPLDKFSVTPVLNSQNLDNFSRWNENSYVEPNLNLINELIANSNMLLKMFSALQLEVDVRLASQDIRNFSDSLIAIRKIVIKELSGEKLNENDNKLIGDFTQQLKISNSSRSTKQLTIKLPNQKSVLQEDLSRLQLLILIHQENDNKFFSVGPVWDYRESH